MMAAVRESTPAAMPDVRTAQLHLRDARLALERPMWNHTQVADVLRSVQHFMDAAKASLKPLKEE